MFSDTTIFFLIKRRNNFFLAARTIFLEKDFFSWSKKENSCRNEKKNTAARKNLFCQYINKKKF